MVGAKRALKPQQVWAIRFWLDREGRLRDRAMFDLAMDLLSHSMRGRYPIALESLQALAYRHLKREFSGPDEVVPVLEQLVAELEGKLAGSPK
jgi:hypothetical protein